MPNENHETYSGVDICTYTDDITTQNRFTAEQIMSYVLSAGVIPWFTNTASVTTGRYSHESATGGPNSNVPFYKESNSQILWYDDSALEMLPADNLYRYKHCVYLAKNNNSNKIATSLKIDNYKNVLTIDTRTYSDIQGNPVKFYSPIIITKYGSGNEWYNSVLAPSFLFRNLNDIVGGQSVGSTISVSRWWWGGENDTGNDLWGHDLYDRNLQYGTDMGGHEMIPWELPGTEPIRISEGGSDPTFPCRFDNEHLTWAFYGNNPLQLFIGTNNIDDCLLLCAFCGLKFEYNGTTYKPLASNGVVYGYTDDMSVTSEWDEWHDIGDHVIPVTPPSPGPGPGPYDDDPWSGVSFSGVGVGGAGAFAKCYYMTSTELANLRSWMNSNNVPEGFDPMQQIIGLSQVPVSLSGDDNTTVQFVNSSAVYDPGVTRLVDSGVNTQISMGTPKRYSLGSVDITRRMQERGEPYLDYDCQIELYLPLIGMFSLDTQAVMGRTITAEAVLDPISGTLAAYAYVSRDGQKLPIAYGSTTIGVDLPISAQQYSVSRASLKQANAQLGSSILSSTLSFIAAATAGGKGSGAGAKTATGSTNGLAAAGIREAGADYMKASQAGNVFGDFMQWGRTIRQLSYGNNTAIAGSFGGSTAQWAYPFSPYVKIIRPRYEKPSNYAHSQGVPCVQTKTVGSCTGFIQCIGVDVSGISGATDIELQAIQAALANGVFAGGGV